jgi:hypothetical protein
MFATASHASGWGGTCLDSSGGAALDEPDRHGDEQHRQREQPAASIHWNGQNLLADW